MTDVLRHPDHQTIQLHTLNSLLLNNQCCLMFLLLANLTKNGTLSSDFNAKVFGKKIPQPKFFSLKLFPQNFKLQIILETLIKV